MCEQNRQDGGAVDLLDIAEIKDDLSHTCLDRLLERLGEQPAAAAVKPPGYLYDPPVAVGPCSEPELIARRGLVNSERSARAVAAQQPSGPATPDSHSSPANAPGQDAP
jgi:hypothetical protein